MPEKDPPVAKADELSDCAIDDSDDGDDSYVEAQRSISDLKKRRASAPLGVQHVVPFHFSPLVQPLTESSVESCVVLEKAALSNPDHRATRDKVGRDSCFPNSMLIGLFRVSLTTLHQIPQPCFCALPLIAAVLAGEELRCIFGRRVHRQPRYSAGIRAYPYLRLCSLSTVSQLAPTYPRASSAVSSRARLRVSSSRHSPSPILSRPVEPTAPGSFYALTSSRLSAMAPSSPTLT